MCIVCRERCSSRTVTTNVGKDAATSGPSDADYEVPDITPPYNRPLHLQHNEAYGKVTTTRIELTENSAYGMVSQ